MRTDIMMMLCSDTYKHTHPRMYPKNLNKLVSYLTVRKNMSEAFDKMVFAGLQPFMMEYLVKGFNEQFFNLPLPYVEKIYKEYMGVQIGVENTETAGFAQGHVPYSDGAGGFIFFVVSHHCVVVHFVDMVTGENHHIIRLEALDKINILVNGIGSTLIPAAFFVVPLVGGQNLRAAVGFVQAPRLSVADVLV